MSSLTRKYSCIVVTNVILKDAASFFPTASKRFIDVTGFAFFQYYFYIVCQRHNRSTYYYPSNSLYFWLAQYFMGKCALIKFLSRAISFYSLETLTLLWHFNIKQENNKNEELCKNESKIFYIKCLDVTFHTHIYLRSHKALNRYIVTVKIHVL